jgi:hypothetical protein
MKQLLKRFWAWMNKPQICDRCYKPTPRELGRATHIDWLCIPCWHINFEINEKAYWKVIK